MEQKATLCVVLPNYEREEKKKVWTQHRASTIKPTFRKWKIKINKEKAQNNRSHFEQKAIRIRIYIFFLFDDYGKM